MEYELIEGDIAKISLANGKANAVSLELAQEFMGLLDRAKTESKGILLCGHAGMFSAGFDLKVMATGPEAATAMVGQGMLLLEKLYSHPHPVVVASEGHAIGMGIFLLLVADYRVGANGQSVYKLPETAIDMPFNTTLKVLAKNHITPLHHSRAIIQSQGYSADEAASNGMLDEACEPADVMDRALEKLNELCALPAKRFEENKLFVREDAIQAIRQSLHG